MSSVNWTDEQRRVIDSRRKNVLVSAAAGSGKTAVLSARILDRILDQENPIDIDRLLVVTFTNAAAAEMRERISRAVNDALESDPDNDHLRKQTTLIHHAEITTYDSFCLNLVRNYFHRVDLSPSLRVADPGEISLLSADVIDRVFTEFYEAGDAEFLALLDCYGSKRDDQTVRDLVQNLARFALSYPWPLEWLDSCEKLYEISDVEELKSSSLIKAVTEIIRATIRGLAEELSACIALAEAPDGPAVYADVLTIEAEELFAISEETDFTALGRKLSARESRRLPAARGFTGDPAKKEEIQERRKRTKTVLDSLIKSFFSQSEEQWLFLIHTAGAQVSVFLALTKRFLALFREVKKEKNILDFSDMEHYALEILIDPETKQPTEIAERYRERFAELMVDEYQDSNYLQEEILRAIAREQDGEKNLFLVGDVKQSIYRFRLARPELFMEKYEKFEVGGTYEERIDLHKNFRSRDEILTVTNDLFARLMVSDLGSIDYDENAALHLGATYPENPETAVRFFVVDSSEEEAGDVEAERMAGEENASTPAQPRSEKIDPVELEAKLIAREIRFLLTTGHVRDEESGGLRELRYSDIVILLRSPGSTGETIAKVLADYGILAMLQSTTGYFAAPEVRLVLSLLAIIDNPRQDIPLTAVLRSPIGGFSDEELAAIRIENPDMPFHEAVFASEKTADFRAALNDFRDRAVYLKVHELLTYVLHVTGYLDYVGALPGGGKRAANLRMLIEKSVAYEKTSYHGLYHFVRYIENIRKYEIDFGEADEGSGKSEVVKILSIHKSKGLEFPVVFVSLLGKRFNKSDQREKLLIHPTYGVGSFAIDGKRRTKRTTLLREGISTLTGVENLGEELRVLYVALTRAKEKLILTGTMEDAKNALERLSLTVRPDPNGRLSYYRRAYVSCFLDWVLPAAATYGDRYPVTVVKKEELFGLEAVDDLAAALSKEAVYARLSGDNGGANEPDDEANSFLQALDFVYPHADEQDIRAKVSVSELKHQAMIFEEGEAAALEWVEKTERPPVVPRFASDGTEENRGALRGSAVHRVMECLDFTETGDFSLWDASRRKAYVEETLDAMRSGGQITEEMYALVSPRLIETFLLSDLAKRMSEAALRGELYKEKPFVMGLSAGQIYHIESDETILVQGIIDVFFREGGEYVIMDYKTDSVADGSKLVKRYQTQLDLYADAVSRNKRAPVREKLIYSFHLGETISL